MRVDCFRGLLNGNPVIVCRDHLPKLDLPAPGSEPVSAGPGLICYFCRKEKVIEKAKADRRLARPILSERIPVPPIRDR